jgi:hypothetical protein
MGRRSLADWQTIIEAQQASGLTIVEYCRHHQLNVKSFGARKAKIKRKAQQLSAAPAAPAEFIQVKPVIAPQMPAVILKTGNVTLQLPPSSTPEWLGQLVREVCL